MLNNNRQKYDISSFIQLFFSFKKKKIKRTPTHLTLYRNFCIDLST